MNRRKLLARFVTFVLGAGAGIASIPFLRSLLPHAGKTPTTIAVEFPKLQPGQLMAVSHPFGGVFYILRRTPEMLAGLRFFEDLRDPASKESTQPLASQNEHRSVDPEYLVVEGECTHLGCSVGYLPPGEHEWNKSAQAYGCFLCPCHGSLYDLAGRVVTGVPAPRNLTVPDYRFTGDKQIEIKDPRWASEV